MTPCRVCGADCGPPVYRAAPPAITSLSTRLDAVTEAHLCRACGHAQSPGLPDLAAFYDTDYRISLASDAHDQLYRMRDGRPVYRTAHQAGLVLAHAAPGQGARMLDYGAAKAATLRALCAARPDLRPYVFDVSEDYRAHWADWVPAGAQATYRAPAEWDGSFDLVTAHFVLEHVAAPVEVLRDIRRLLAPGGRAFVTVPDLLANPGDLLVVDHANHFTQASIARALAGAGMRAEAVLTDAFRGAFVIVAVAGAAAPAGDVAPTLAAVEAVAAFWRDARARLLAAAERHGDRPAAIYGAGFYGVFVAAALAGRQRLVGHLDRNPHVRAAAPVRPVFDPMRPPEGIELVYAGLNPAVARRVLADWLAETGRDYPLVFLDEAA